MKKDVTVDGLQKTTYLKDDMDGKIAIKEQVDVTSHLKHNKQLLVTRVYLNLYLRSMKLTTLLMTMEI